MAAGCHFQIQHVRRGPDQNFSFQASAGAPVHQAPQGMATGCKGHRSALPLLRLTCSVRWTREVIVWGYGATS